MCATGTGIAFGRFLNHSIMHCRDYWGVYECHYSCPGCDPHTTCKAGYTCYNDLAFVEHLVRNILLEELNIDQSR